LLDCERQHLAPPQAGAANTSFAETAFALLNDADPSLRTVSVVVAADDSADQAARTLATTWQQVSPVFQTIVLADGLTSPERSRLSGDAAGAGRELEFSAGTLSTDSTSALAAAAAAATGELLWLVPAGAAPDEHLLEDMVAALG